MPAHVTPWPLFLLLSSLPLLLTGCPFSETGGIRYEPLAAELDAAVLPRFEIGDRRYLSNGRYEEVIALDGDLVTWRSSNGTRYRVRRNFIFPPLLKETAGRRVSNEFEAAEDLLWPLQPGNKGWFPARRTSLDKGSGRRISSKRDWYCRVKDGVRLGISAGRFDAYPVECDRTDEMGRFRQRWLWYYSPLLEQVVLRRIESPRRPERRLELVAFQPSLDRLSRDEIQAYRERFQWVMEELASGNTEWYQARGSGHRIAIIPLQSLRLRDGHYCRRYRLRVVRGSSRRWGAGIVCRDDAGRWRIPGHSV